jgi:chorismate mutase
VVDCNGAGGPALTAIYVKRLHMAGRLGIRGLVLSGDLDGYGDLFSLLNSVNSKEICSLGEIRKLIRLYDAEIFKRLNADAFYNVGVEHVFTLTDYMFEQNKFIGENCADSALKMLVACRLALSEKVAEIKYRAGPFNFLHKGNDFLKLVTDREIEKCNLRLFPHQTYLKIMDVSKEIQVQYLERATAAVKIGYLFGRGTFSAEAVGAYFRGTHVAYSSLALLTAALESKAVDYICIPTYNSLIGEIIQPESYWLVNGTVDHCIDLCLYSNVDVGPGEKFKPEVLYLEPHVQKEAENYLDAHFGKSTEVILVDTSKTGCVRCIKDIDVRHAMTISSKNNNSNFLHMVADNIVKHNITTFSLIGM